VIENGVKHATNGQLTKRISGNSMSRIRRKQLSLNNVAIFLLISKLKP